MTNTPQPKQIYQALNFSLEYPIDRSVENSSIKAFIYTLRHKGWTKKQICQSVNEKYPYIGKQEVRNLFDKTISSCFDYFPQETSFSSSLAPVINSGLIGLQSFRRAYNNSGAELLDPVTPTQKPNRHKITKFRTVLKLNGCPTRLIGQIAPSSNGTCVFRNDLVGIGDRIKAGAEVDNSENSRIKMYLEQEKYHPRVLVYFVLLLRYVRGELDFDTDEQMQILCADIYQKYGREIFTSQKLKNLIQSNNTDLS